MGFRDLTGGVYERLPIITNAAHCARALSLVEQGGIYFGIGRTTPWEGENASDFLPPEPNVDATTLDELIGLKKAERAVMVMPDENGEIEYATLKFKTLSNEEALREKARWVLIETTIRFDEMPPVPYRQIGVFSRVKPNAGFENRATLKPEEIEDVGILEVLDNRKVITRQSDTRDTYMMIIEC
ncbi:MAG: hypothetical protein GXZ11_01300 [Tissierellia bacterium]|nr:hypothetical protein [Tissierellia bacterium]